MIRIHFTADDVARVRFAPRPAPLLELNVALMTMVWRDDLIFGRWRRRVLRSLPGAVRPMQDLVPGYQAPTFLDVFSDTLNEGFDTIRATRPDVVRSELERVYAASRPTFSVPPWVRDLHSGRTDAWRLLFGAQQAAFDAVLGPVWPLVQDLHRAEFARHALTAAEHGLAASLASLVPGTRLHQDVWELDGPGERDITLGGRGMVLLPTFHWAGHPLISSLPDRPVTVTYSAGPGLPLMLAGVEGGARKGGGAVGSTEDALIGVIGRTRFEILLLLEREHTTSDLARRLGLSNATASAHTAALRAAGLITTVRAGRAVLHQRTALGSLLVG